MEQHGAAQTPTGLCTHRLQALALGQLQPRVRHLNAEQATKGGGG